MEAKAALENAANIAKQCESDACTQNQVDDQLLNEVSQWCGDGNGHIERRKDSTSLVAGFLGDESENTWAKIYGDYYPDTLTSGWPADNT